MTRTLTIAVTLFVAVAALPARADRASAESYFRAGAKAYAAQNFSAAAEDFDEAYKQMPLPEIAFSAAQAYRKLYRVEPKPAYVQRSVELYKVYLSQVKTGGRVGDAADSLGEMERELATLKPSAATVAPEAPHTRLGVNVTISDQGGGANDTAALHEIGDATGIVAKGLTATLDGKPLEPFALVDVDAKEHVISVSADGYLAVEKKAMAVSGQSQLIEVELKPKPASVTLATEDGADVAIDGRTIATAPTAPLELGAGKHLLAITHRGRVPFVREINVGRGESTTVTASLDHTGRRRAVPYVTSVALGLTAATVIAGIVAHGKDSDASNLDGEIAMGNRPASDADRYDALVTSRDHWVTATWVLGGAAVAAGAAAAGLYFFDHPSSETVRVQPLAGRGAGGLALSGSW